MSKTVKYCFPNTIQEESLSIYLNENAYMGLFEGTITTDCFFLWI